MTRPHLVLLKSPSGLSTSAARDSRVSVTHLPLLTTSFNLSRLSTLVLDPASFATEYDGIVFCSQRSVHAFATVLERSSVDAAVRPPRPRPTSFGPCFVVGLATKQALVRVLDSLRDSKDGADDDDDDDEALPEVVGEHSGTGQVLAREILDYFQTRSTTEAARGKRLLFLGGDKSTESLPRALAGRADDVRLEKIQVYSTDIATEFDDTFVERLTELLSNVDGDTAAEEEEEEDHPRRSDRGGNVWIGICSPSGAKHVVSVLRSHAFLPPFDLPSTSARQGRGRGVVGESSPRLRIVAIGTTTRDYLENDERVTVHATAKVPGEEGMIDAVVLAEACERQGECLDRGTVGTAPGRDQPVPGPA
ncbi:hypothetical protein JCM11491_004452 [Sporobolomyces phaffii]